MHRCPNHLCDSSHSLKGLDKENPLLLQPCARPNHPRQPKIQAPLSASDLCFRLRHQNHVCILRYPMVLFPICLHFTSLWGSLVKNLPTNAEDMGLIPGLVRFPGEGNGYRLEYCLGNPKDKAALWSTVDCHYGRSRP